MKADLLLSRPSYRSGTQVVGTVRIHRDYPDASVRHDADNPLSRGRPIRDEIVSARLYLSGRAHLGSGGGKGSRWRSTQEVNQLKNIYGEHACLTMAVVEEQSNWGVWNGETDEVPLGNLDNDTYNDDVGISDNNHDRPTRSTFRRKMQRPRVTQIEQAERLAVHSFLHHKSSGKTKHDEGDCECNPSNGYSHLPSAHENDVICFWMTNVIELLDVPERHLDRLGTENRNLRLRPGRGKFFGDMHPCRPLQLPDSTVLREILQDMKEKSLHKNDTDIRCDASPSLFPKSAWERIVASANTNKNTTAGNDSSSVAPLDQIQVVISFRANLPPDVPPTMSTECVKYFYTAVLLVTTADGEFLVTHCQFLVLVSNLQSCQPSHQNSLTRVHIGELHAMAHSVALPIYISSTEASNANPPQLKVEPSSPACDIVSRRTAEQRTSTHRIQDREGCYCGSMTLIGIGGPLVPGTRLGIRVQFPIFEDNEISIRPGIIPCHRVCCALVGEEYAIFEGSVTRTVGNNLQKGKKRVKTRSYVFDSRYELVEFGYTEAISMALVLPLDCPVTVMTDLVEVTVTLKMEFTVGRLGIEGSDIGMQTKDHNEFKVIGVDLPCRVVHGKEGSSFLASEGEEDESTVQSRRMMEQFRNNTNKRYDNGFDDIEIQTDLKLLSLRMKELYTDNIAPTHAQLIRGC
ncbi:hypothetical protein ACHAXA_001905 [Cyclostephanos tholiformis]|uniref:Uncharacterized protein n=1 Tax=Cyclostephanos tholiformis TaxID=382380 RepID=A0ABD3RWB2_9STRA